MAIQKVTGEIIENNLLRSASLAFNTDLLYIDVINDRIGINTSAPGTALDVTGSARFTGDLTVQGNLDVEGQTSIIDTVNLEVEDPILLLGRNNSGSDIDLGIMMNRGAGNNNAVFYWNEGEDAFKMVTSSSADSTTAITDTAYAPLQVGKITVDQEIEITDNEIRTTTSNADLALSASGSGTVSINGMKFPTSDGTSGYHLQTDGAGNLSWVSIAGGVIGDLTISGSTISAPSNADITFDNSGTGDYIFEGTGQLTVPKGTTGQRPSAGLGIIRFNTSTGKYEGSTDGSTFVSFNTGSPGATITKDTYTTGNASTTDFTLTLDPATASNIIVYVDNVIQEPTQNYSLSGSTLALDSAPHSGARVVVMHGFD